MRVFENWNIENIHYLPITHNQLDGQGKARREAARRRNPECKINLSSRNSSRSNGSRHWSLRRVAGQSPLRCRPTALGIAASGGLTSGFALHFYFLFVDQSSSHRLEKFGEDILTSPEVNYQGSDAAFKPNFKFSRLKMFRGDPRPSCGVRYQALVNL